MFRFPVCAPPRSITGTWSVLSHSPRTMLPALRIASARALSCSGGPASLKIMSKAMTAGFLSVKLLIRRACMDRGHFLGAEGKCRWSAEALSSVMMITSGGALRFPLILNNKCRPIFSSSSVPNGVRLTTIPKAPTIMLTTAVLYSGVIFQALECIDILMQQNFNNQLYPVFIKSTETMEK